MTEIETLTEKEITENEIKEEVTIDELTENNFFIRYMVRLVPMVIFGVSFDLMFRLLLFRNIGLLGAIRSVGVFLVIHAVFAVIYTILLTALNDDSMTGPFVGATFPGVIYTVLTRPETEHRFFLTLSIVCGIFAVVILVIMIYKKANRNKTVWKALGAFIKTAGVALFAVVIGPIFASVMFSTGPAFSKKALDPVVIAKNRFSDTALIDANRESLSALYDFDEMSAEERLDMLQLLANIEAEYLGIERPVVTVSNLKEGTWGEYMGMDKNIIRIDAGHLVEENCEDILHTLFHECFHAYIAALTEKYPDTSGELLFERELDAYRFEEQNYVSPNFTDDFSLYRDQLCERRCNEYAVKRLEDYKSMIRF